MSEYVDAACTMTSISDAMRTGNTGEAKRHASTLLKQADDASILTLAEIARIQQGRPALSVPRLRAYWKLTGEDGPRRLIAAAAPQPDETRRWPETRTDTTPPAELTTGHLTERGWSHPDRTADQLRARTGYRAPRDQRHEIRPELRKPAVRPQDRTPAVVRDYDSTRAGKPEGDPAPEQPDGYALDYDNAARCPQRGTCCVSCFIERTSADQHRHPDDGLCSECRDAGQRGIAPLHPWHANDPTADVQARCAYIAARFPRAARALLRRDWQASPAKDRATIEEWIAHNALPDTRSAEPAALAIAA